MGTPSPLEYSSLAPPRQRWRLPRMQELGLVIVIVLLALLISYAGGSVTLRGGAQVNNFFRPDNILPSVLTPISWMSIMAIGVTFVIITGGIDISVGSIFGLSALIGADVLQHFSEQAPAWQVIPVAVAVTVGVGLLCGLINGMLVMLPGMHPFIVTLATMSIYRGVMVNWTEGVSLPDQGRSLPVAFTTKLIAWEMPYHRANGSVILLQPVPTIIMIVCVLLAWIYLRYTVWGRENYAIGGNEEAARFSGIRVGMVKLRVYVLSGLCAGIAAMVLLGYYGSASTQTGESYELMVIAAAVVGGASLLGGRGTALGATLGALIMQLIENGITIIHKLNLVVATVPVSKKYSKIIVGIAILLAVGVDLIGQRIQNRRLRR